MKGVNIMTTKMMVNITIRPHYSYEIYNRLRPYRVDISDRGGIVQVSTTIDIREDTIEKILNICKEYGDCSIDARLVDEKAPL